MLTDVQFFHQDILPRSAVDKVTELFVPEDKLEEVAAEAETCLLYTSDAADE